LNALVIASNGTDIFEHIYENYPDHDASTYTGAM
jgi:hypothetical protein